MKKFLLGFTYAARGIAAGVYSERNMKFHLLAAIAVGICGFYVHVSSMEWVVLLLCIGGVIAFELMNTAIEKLTNLVSPEYDPRAGMVKDLAAGAVLVVSIISAIIGCIILIPKLL